MLTISNNTIRIIDGLYSLNDLHKASGNNKKHQPAFFLRNQEIIELIKEIKHSSNLQSSEVINRINGGLGRGTYVCKELVYRYAMWVNLKFALLIIRTFDSIASSPQELSDQLNKLCNELDTVNALLTSAGRLLCVGGKRIKPQLKSHIDITLKKIQLSLEFARSDSNEN